MSQKKNRKKLSKRYFLIILGEILIGVGVLIFALLMVFALDSESRHLATLIPLLLLPLGEVLNSWRLKKYQIFSLVGIQLLLSHFYLPINSENILSETEL